MIEAGKKYKIELLDSYDDEGRAGISSIVANALYVDGPLVKFNIAGQTTIVNTYSLVFVRATLVK